MFCMVENFGVFGPKLELILIL